jgi:hypothetical protein
MIAGEDRYLPGPGTADRKGIEAAAGLAEWLRAPRRRRGFGGPMLLALAAIALLVVVISLHAVL